MPDVVTFGSPSDMILNMLRQTAPTTHQEMRLFTETGERLYLDQKERQQFLHTANTTAPPSNRLLCHVLHYTGCRSVELIQLTPEHVLLDDAVLVFRSAKKKKVDGRGRPKAPVYRQVPVPWQLVNELDLVFDLRRRSKKERKEPLWPVTTKTIYRRVKCIMNAARITGPQATAKGLRHGFGVAMITAEKPVSIFTLAEMMGHSSVLTTQIYTQAVGADTRDSVLRAWGDTTVGSAAMSDLFTQDHAGRNAIG